MKRKARAKSLKKIRNLQHRISETEGKSRKPAQGEPVKGNASTSEQMEIPLALESRIAKLFLTVSDDEMYNEVLKVILDVMQSPFGVFGYLDTKGALVVPTMTRQIWEKCQVPDKTIVFPRATWGNSTWPRAILEKKVLYSNEASTRVPEGHVKITRNISLPILFQSRVIGLFQVANKETDYTESDIKTLKAIAERVAPLLSARLQRDWAEEEMRAANRHLEASNQQLRSTEQQLRASNQQLRATEQQLRASNQQLRATEQQLRASNQQLSASMERLADAQTIARLGSWEWDMEKDTLSGSGEFYRLFGIGPDQLLTYRDFLNLLHPDDRQRIEKEFKEALRKKTGFEIEYRIKTPDRECRHIQSRGKVFANDAGKPVRMAGTCLDITGPKRAEEALRESEEKYRLIADNADAWIYLTTADGKITYTSPSCEHLTGYAPAEFRKTAHLIQNLVYPDDRSIFENHLKKVNKSEEPHDLEFRIVKKNGDIRWLSHSCVPVLAADGAYIGRRGANRDITERKQAEHDLKASETRYRRLFESAKDGILILDADSGRIVDVNPFLIDLTGFTHEEFLDRYLWEIGPFRNIAAARISFKKLQAKKYIRYEDLPLETRDRRKIDVEFVSNVYRVNNKSVIQCNIRDITERKQRESRIMHLNTILGAVRDINQLIIEKKDRKILIQKACRILTRKRGYSAAWIILTDRSGKLTDSASAGMGNKFKQIEEQFLKGILNECCKKALSQSGVVIIEDVQKECSLLNTEPEERAFAIRLSHGDDTYGLLSVSLPKNFITDHKEQALFQEMANDIGFSLFNIELEEKEKRALLDLTKSEEHYRNYFEKDLSGIYISTPRGKLLDCNPVYVKLMGYDSKTEIMQANQKQLYEKLKTRNDFLKKLKENKFLVNNEIELIRKDGKKIFCLENVIGNFSNQGKLIQFQGYIIDISLRREAELNQNLTIDILKILNRPNKRKKIIWDFLELIKTRMGMSAVAIRLEEGGDYPYFVHNGFSAEFLETENSLCKKMPSGEIFRDDRGDPVLECMCGAVIRGETEVGRPYFTKGGSFWTNSTSKLLAGTKSGDFPVVTRNRCASQGYESIALIPLRSGNTIIGLLQLNDRRPDRLSEDMIQFYEGLGNSIGIVISRRKMEEELEENQKELQKAQKVAHLGNWIWNIKKNRVEWSDEMYRIFDIEKENFTGDLTEVIRRAIHPEDRAKVESSNLAVIRDKKPVPLEYRVVRKDGSIRTVWAEAGELRVDKSGKPEVLTGIVQDITERKQAETIFRKSEENYRNLIENINDVLFSTDEKGVLTYISPPIKQISSFEPDEIIGKPFTDFIYREDIPFVQGQFQKLRSGSIEPSEYRMVSKSGEIRWIRTSSRPVMKGKKFCGLQGMLTDITDRKNAEILLAASEERFRTLFETMSQGVVYQDKSGRIILANPAAERILGLTIDHMMGRTSLDPRWLPIHEDGSAFPGDTHPFFFALKTGKPVKNVLMGVYNPIKKDRIWININAIPQFRKGKKIPFQVYTTIEDITEPKKIFSDLQSSEERLKILFEFAPDALYLNDLKGNFIDGNRQAEKLIGRKKEKLIGRNMFEAFELSREDKIIAAKALKKNALGQSTERDEFTLTRPDGSRVVLEISTHPVKIGNESLVLGIARDITEPKKMQNELDKYRNYLEDLVRDRTEKLNLALMDSENNRNRIDTILKSISEGLIVTDINHHVILMNSRAEDWLGIRFSEIYNQSIDKGFHDKKLYNLIQQSLEEKTRTVSLDLRIPGIEDKENQIFEATAKGILDKSNKPLGVITTLRDVSREREIDRMKTEFLSTAAHELRTPLTTIQGFSEILLTRNDLQKEEKEKFLNYINKQSVNLANILNDLLDISRIESGAGFKLKKKKCLMNEIIDRLIENYRISHTKHAFVTNLEKSNTQIFADGEKMEQVMQNLLSNAVNYSPGGGKILITTEATANEFRVMVEDNGIGMTKHQLKNIFEKFYRADTSDTAPKGTGLGMSIVKLIIDAHKGNIRVESEPKRGTRVIFTLPAGRGE